MGTTAPTRRLPRRLREIVAAVAATAGLGVYLVTSTTGYLQGRGVDPLLILLSVVGIVALVGDVVLRGRLNQVTSDVLLLGAVATLAASLGMFILARVPLAADVYFIPVNYPAAEETTLHVSFVGIGLGLVAVLALVVESFVVRRTATATPVAATA